MLTCKRTLQTHNLLIRRSPHRQVCTLALHAIQQAVFVSSGTSTKNSLVLYSCRKLCSGVTVVCRRRTNTFAWEWSGSLPTGRVTFLKHIHCRCHLYLAVCMYSKKTHAAALYFCINDKHIHKSQ